MQEETENKKVLSDLLEETKRLYEVILALKIRTGELEGKIDNLGMVISENTVEMINVKAKIENIEKILKEEKEEQEDDEMYDFSEDFGKEELLNTLCIKILRLTERVEALEKQKI